MKRVTNPLAALVLTSAHGYRSEDGAGERWLERRFRARFATDYLAAQRTVEAATPALLRAFVVANNRRPAESHRGLEGQALLCIMAVWWPEQVMPATTRREEGITSTIVPSARPALAA